MSCILVARWLIDSIWPFILLSDEYNFIMHCTCAMTLEKVKYKISYSRIFLRKSQNEDKLSTRELALQLFFEFCSILCNKLMESLLLNVMRKQLFAVGNCSKSFRFSSLIEHTHTHEFKHSSRPNGAAWCVATNICNVLKLIKLH